MSHYNEQQMQISLLQESLTIPGVQLNMRGMAIAPSVTDQQLLNVGSRLIAVGGFLAWAWADYLNTLTSRAVDAAYINNPRITTEKALEEAAQHIARYCDAHQIDPKLRREYLGVALFYAPEDRPYNLSYEHYREVMWATRGDRTKARKYLGQAEANEWSLAELRKHIRQAQAGVQQAAPKQSLFADYVVVHDFARYASVQVEEVARFTEERCRAILEDLQPAKKLITRLEERVGFVNGRPTPV